MMFALLLAAALAAPLTPDEVVAAALTHDPTLAEADAAVVAAQGEKDSTRGLPAGPTLDLRLGLVVPQHEASLTQPVSLSGERRAAGQAADAGLRAAAAERERLRLVVAAHARRLMIRTIAAHAELDRRRQTLGLATELRQAAERRLTSGDAAELEVHLARLEESAATADLAEATVAAMAAREALSATTGLAPDVVLPEDPMSAAPAEVGVGERADQRGATARLEEAESALRRERGAALPPIALGVWAQVQNVATSPSTSGVSVAPWSWSENAAWTVGPTLSVTLPVRSANRAGIGRAAGDLQFARAQLAAVKTRIAAEQAGGADRRAVIALVQGTADPTTAARAALAGVDAAVANGSLSPAEAALTRARVLDLWGRAAAARAGAAETVVDLALAESWSSLLPDAPRVESL